MLCQFKMPGAFTVKAGFNMPTKQSSSSSSSSSSSPSGSLEPVDVSYEEEPVRGGREFSDYSSIITAQSLDTARLSKMLTAGANSASQRHSRTVASNLFGGQQVGDEADREADNHKMWMIVITVSAGLVVVSVMAVLVVCRPASSLQEEELAGVQADDISASSQVNVNDTEALQPKKKDRKKVYRPSESRA